MKRNRYNKSDRLRDYKVKEMKKKKERKDLLLEYVRLMKKLNLLEIVN